MTGRGVCGGGILTGRGVCRGGILTGRGGGGVWGWYIDRLGGVGVVYCVCHTVWIHQHPLSHLCSPLLGGGGGWRGWTIIIIMVFDISLATENRKTNYICHVLHGLMVCLY